MKKINDLMHRTDIKEKNLNNKTDMQKAEENLEEISDDIQTVRETIKNLDLKGTLEGALATEQHLNSAEDVTQDVFSTEDSKLEKIHDDSQQFENNLQERGDSSEADLKKVTDHSTKIKTNDTIGEIKKAQEAILDDLDFLNEQVQEAKTRIEESKNIQARLKTIIQK